MFLFVPESQFLPTISWLCCLPLVLAAGILGPSHARARSMEVVWCVSISTLTYERTTAQSTQLPSLISSEYCRRHSSSY